MRVRLSLLFLPLLLWACSKINAPVRLDFIGNSTLTSGSRTVNANDTLTTRAYAKGDDNLARLRITVKYEPTRDPILYPVPITGYDPTKARNDDEFVYLDSVLVVKSPPAQNFSGKELLFSNKFSARSTSGTELWQYTVTDSKGQSASRAYRLTVHKPDSAAVFHSYSSVLRPALGSPVKADSIHNQARAFLNLPAGLLLPKYAVLNNENSVQSNQLLVDLICLANSSSLSLCAPAADSLTRKLSNKSWPSANRRRTVVVATSLSATDFDKAATTAAFATAFSGGRPSTTDTLSSGPLAKNTVVAFKTWNGLNGLILVTNVVPGTSPVLNCSIKVQKR